jgi:hypothetical protein
MADINRIDVLIATASGSGSGTDGNVYIGVAGREFYIDSAQDDFEEGDSFTYVLGQGANVLNAGLNDPRSPQLSTFDVDRWPVYLRFEPAGDNADWHLEGVIVTVNPGPSQVQYRALKDSPDLWLGQRMGKQVFLKKQ